MTKINLPDDVHARLKAYAEDRGYKSLGVAVEVLLDVRDEANRSFIAALSIVESRSASAATKPAPRTHASKHFNHIFNHVHRITFFPNSSFFHAGTGVIAAQANKQTETKP